MAGHTVAPEPTIITGTGRCGSTMLSAIVREHPQLLSISEFLDQTYPHPSPSALLTGEELWEQVATPHGKYRLMVKHGLDLPEMLYPLSALTPAQRRSGVPPILLVTLPHMTDSYVRLFEQLHLHVVDLPVQRIGEHYRAMFDWLTRELGRETWVERSGGSLGYYEAVRKMLPARTIHIARDGRDCAMSMSSHDSARLEVVGRQLSSYAGKNPYYDAGEVDESSVPRALRAFLPGSFDVSAYRAHKIDIAEFGRFWSAQMTAGAKALDAPDVSNVLNIRYEFLCRAPCGHLAEVIRHIGLPADPRWVRSASRLVGAPRGGSWLRLAGDERRRLDEACAPGMAVIDQR